MTVGKNGVTERTLTGQEAIDFEARRTVRREEGRPRNITKVRMQRWLRANGLWGQVKAALASSSQAIREDWEATNTIKRSDVIVSNMGLTKAQLDAMYEEGQVL
jgi:hypothetical protein